MSLFLAREWWTVKFGAGELFSDGGLAVGPLIGDRDTSQIITGSLEGLLRVHESNEARDIVATCLLEAQFDAPILQVEVGHLIVHHDKYVNGLCILHPLKVIVYIIQSRGISLGSPNSAECRHHELLLQYSHRFDQEVEHFSALSMCLGPFGDEHADVTLVQSIDGRILIYDCDVR